MSNCRICYQFMLSILYLFTIFLLTINVTLYVYRNMPTELQALEIYCKLQALGFHFVNGGAGASVE